jgi:hypothetical protein
MKKPEWMKTFQNEAAWSAVEKTDREIKKLVKKLNDVILNEIFDKYYLGFINKSDIDIEELRSQFLEINSLLYNRKIVTACRRIKGFMEDSLTFICQNHEPNSVRITSNTSPSEFRKYIIDNSNEIFSILHEQVSKDLDYLTRIYNYVAKVDHTTSIRNYTKSLEENKEINNVQYTYFNILFFIVYLIFDFKFTHDKQEVNDDILFVIKTFSALSMVVSISFMKNYNHGEYLKLDLLCRSNSIADERYLNDLKDWSKRVIDKTTEDLTNEVKDLFRGFMSSYEIEFKNRGY